MHDTESDTFVIKSVPEQYSDKLEKIGISSSPIEITTDEMENDDYVKEWVLYTNYRVIPSAYGKYDDKNVIETEIDSQKKRIELLERNNLDQEKKDMWDD